MTCKERRDMRIYIQRQTETGTGTGRRTNRETHSQEDAQSETQADRRLREAAENSRERQGRKDKRKRDALRHLRCIIGFTEAWKYVSKLWSSFVLSLRLPTKDLQDIARL